MPEQSQSAYPSFSLSLASSTLTHIGWRERAKQEFLCKVSFLLTTRQPEAIFSALHCSTELYCIAATNLHKNTVLYYTLHIHRKKEASGKRKLSRIKKFSLNIICCMLTTAFVHYFSSLSFLGEKQPFCASNAHFWGAIFGAKTYSGPLSTQRITRLQQHFGDIYLSLSSPPGLQDFLLYV